MRTAGDTTAEPATANSQMSTAAVPATTAASDSAAPPTTEPTALTPATGAPRTAQAAALHLARTGGRRAERVLVRGETDARRLFAARLERERAPLGADQVRPESVDMASAISSMSRVGSPNPPAATALNRASCHTA